MTKQEINILELIHEILILTGNPLLVKIFDKYRNNENQLSIALKQYIRGIYNDTREDDGEEEEESKNKVINRYAYINGVVIDVGNISRIELDSEYNPKKNRNNYFIRIVKKYPSPLEEEYIIPFNSEEDRDRGYDILKAKLKLCNIFIV